MAVLQAFLKMIRTSTHLEGRAYLYGLRLSLSLSGGPAPYYAPSSPFLLARGHLDVTT